MSKLSARVRYHWRDSILPLAGIRQPARYFRWLYMLPDPYCFRSGREQARFERTAEIVKANFGELGSILEAGCGEGHQSVHLAGLCRRLVGFDLSGSAIARARRRLPGADLRVQDFEGFLGGRPEPFDLVCACELLYYLPDPRAALERLSRLGRACLVSYYRDAMPSLDPICLGMPSASSATIEHGKSLWRVVWWRNPPASA